ncbi:small integral membrane protein 26-like isoform X2 [Denticeps clupeoides]|uniref:small integral membrane protein 26-like isoform X2 n=1 Tax=Denticeps clupeoides TaxID=299321 RepID=UPI0010A3182C|nr:small integral membrane protein 26 isoform X2 [Denticeps clupeoides]
MTCVTSLLRHAGRLAGAATGNDAEPPANGRALGRGEFTHRTGRDSGSMAPSDVVKWNKRVSLLYAIGAWTMFGSCGYYWYARRSEPRAPVRPEVEDREQDPNVKIYETKYSKTTIVYRPDFVPYSDRILNFFKSFSVPISEEQRNKGEK